MKIFMRILVVLLVIIILVLAIGFLLPRKVRVERSLAMKAHPALVFDQVINLHNWGGWSPWHQKDTAMKISYFGPSMGVGAGYDWQSDNKDLGSGKLSINGAGYFDSISLSMEFREQGTAYSHFLFKPDSEGTEVVWSMETDMGNNPISRYFGLFMVKNIGKDFEQGLDAMRRLVEANPNAMLKIDTGSVPLTPYLAMRGTLTEVEIGPSMGEWYGELMTYLATENIQMAGPPFCIYHTWENNSFDLEACIPLSAKASGAGAILAGELPAGKILTIDYYGPYEGTYAPHMAIEAYIRANKLKVKGSPWEVYLNDPMTEKDPAKLLTRVVWPVE